MGGDKRKIAESAAEKAEAFRRGRIEVENHEKLAQVYFFDPRESRVTKTVDRT